MHIGSLFARNARYRPSHLAVVFGDRRLTHLEFNREINRLANALLALGVNRGDTIATLLPNCLELLELYGAAAKIGAVVVPLSTLLRGKELAGLLLNADAAMLVTNSGIAATVESIKAELSFIAHDRYLLTDGSRTGFRDYNALKSAAGGHEPEGEPVGGEDPYTIIFSSGATGLPKGIVHTHRIRCACAAAFTVAFRMAPESVTLLGGDMVLNEAFIGFMPAVLTGGTFILLPRFTPQVCIDTIAREKVTHVTLAPSQIIALMDAVDCSAEKLGSLQMVLPLGAPLHREQRERLERILPGRFHGLYGLTEGFVTVLDKFDYPRKPESVGVPPPFCELKIVDAEDRELPPREVGEICGRGPLLTTGYYKRPDLTRHALRDGWLHSGDLGYLDEEGFLYLVNRKKEITI
mgnify:CR=1 FL=1